MAAIAQLGPGHIGPSPKKDKEGNSLHFTLKELLHHCSNTQRLNTMSVCVMCIMCLYSDDCLHEEEQQRHLERGRGGGGLPLR